MLRNTRVITVFCTEIASLAGRHAYKTTNEAADAFLMHNENIVFNQYPHLRERLKIARLEDVAARKEDNDRKRRHADLLDSTVKKMKAADTPEDAKLELESGLCTVDDPDERKALSSIVYRTRGVENESVALDIYEKVTGRALSERSTSFRTSDIFVTPGGHRYRIGGRLDAICEKISRVVEVKSRMNAFFIPTYDEAQVYGYFAITGLKECDFIQTLGKEFRLDVIEFDAAKWDMLKNELELSMDGILCKTEDVSSETETLSNKDVGQ